MVKIAALTVNGSGPFTEWKTVETYSNDLVGEFHFYLNIFLN